jgi:CelD/BcsL family acetyltransferase involved in cellulose biosynthesis
MPSADPTTNGMGAMDLRTAEHRQLTSVRGLVEEWQALHDASGDPNPFSGPDWAVTWLDHFAHGEGHEPFVVEVRDGDRLVGVAPLYRRRILRGRGTVLQPIGTGDPWIGPYELPTLLAAPTHGRDVARALVSRLCEQAGAWDWATLVLGSTAPWLEPEWLPDWSFTLVERRVRAAVVLDLSTGVDIYAGRRNLKESFRRARNRLTRDFGAEGWSVRRVTESSSVPAAWDRLVSLHNERAGLGQGRPVHADVLADPSVRAYLRSVVGQMSTRGCASFYELLIGGDVVASQLVLHTGCASYSSVSGVAERAWPYSAITYLQSLVVKDAQDAGQRQVNLSIGPNQPKLRWTDRVQPAVEFGIIGPRRRSRLLYLGVEAHGVLAAYREARRAHRV